MSRRDQCIKMLSLSIHVREAFEADTLALDYYLVVSIPALPLALFRQMRCPLLRLLQVRGGQCRLIPEYSRELPRKELLLLPYGSKWNTATHSHIIQSCIKANYLACSSLPQRFPCYPVVVGALQSHSKVRLTLCLRILRHF